MNQDSKICWTHLGIYRTHTANEIKNIRDYYADAVGELILSRVGVSFLCRRKALRPLYL